jgi:hypothetical protein
MCLYQLYATLQDIKKATASLTSLVASCCFIAAARTFKRPARDPAREQPGPTRFIIILALQWVRLMVLMAVVAAAGEMRSKLVNAKVNSVS